MSCSENQKPHFVMLPAMAQGHIIPMIDTAKLLARCGAIVTILTTHHNGNRLKTVIARAIESGLNINVHYLKFPCVEAGLPEGCENFDMLPSMGYATKFFAAVGMLKDQVQEFLKELEPLPSCLIADMFFPWSTNVAKKMHIPGILFGVSSCFALLCMHILTISKDFEAIPSDFEYFVVPGLPDKIEMTKAQFMGTVIQHNPIWNEARDKMREAEVEALGIITNTFEELESEYINEYKRVKDKKVWCIGPVSLCNKDELDKAERGSKASIDGHECLKWLDSQEPTSVLYVCLGSMSLLTTSQLMELGLALEASKRPFIWAIRNASDEFKTWLLEEKFDERTNGRGLLIHGWAPQVLILSHPSLGAFLTHCGWNSTLEGMVAGLPMITWPHLSDQFCIEKFIVNVIKTGVRVGVELPVFMAEEKMGVLVKNDEIKRAIDRLMDGGEEGDQIRKRAQKLGEMAKGATEEGGSSYRNVTLLIQDVINYQEDDADQRAKSGTLDH